MNNTSFQPPELSDENVKNIVKIGNQLLPMLPKKAKGDVIFHLQDCISIENDTLERVLLNHDTPNKLITYPVGKKSGDSVKWDWRYYCTVKDPLQYSCWETDMSSCEKRAFFDVGGGRSYAEQIVNKFGLEK